jgi:hypothetical protein
LPCRAVLDFLIVVVSILGLLSSIVPAFGKLKALRILRVLRPLRLLQRNPGMKIIVASLFSTLPPVIEVPTAIRTEGFATAERCAATEIRFGIAAARSLPSSPSSTSSSPLSA